MGERYRLVPGARLRPDTVRGGVVLLLPEQAIFLNETAAEILELCQGMTLEEIVEALRARYEGGPELVEDVRSFLEEALARRWICRI